MMRKWKRFDVRDIENLRGDLNKLGEYGNAGDILYRVLSAVDNELAEMREMIEDLKNKGGDNK